MPAPTSLKILFILNKASGGRKKIDWKDEIEKFFENHDHDISFYTLQKTDNENAITKLLSETSPDRIVAVGGDGTINLVGKLLLGKKTPLGILKGGSANGLATELKIPTEIKEALDVITGEEILCMDAVKINDDVSFHLSDVGMNARLIKYFEDSNFRGMWNYARMLFKVLFTGRLMRISIKTNEETKTINAYMVVIANASKYGSGAVINPKGKLCDGHFELVVVRKITVSEFIKLFWSYKSFDPKKVEIISTTKAYLTLGSKNHFQVDGEYIGKIKAVHAEVISEALNVMVPNTEEF